MVTVARAAGSLEFPAQFMLVAAMNPCPCGHANNPAKQCVCSPGQISRYKRKISGPLLDRIDLHIDVPAVKYEKLSGEKIGEESKHVKARVQQARQIQQERFEKESIKTNSEMNLQQLKKYCQLNEEGQQILRTAVNNLHLSARSYHRILKISRTIADLAQAPMISPSHLAEALQYRPREENF